MTEWWYDWGAPAVIFGILFLCIALMIGGSLFAAHQSCVNTGELMQVKVRWAAFGGCFLQVDGEWVPLASWRNVQVQEGQ